MKGLIILAVPVVMITILSYLRKPGKGGILGSRIRSSDWASWKDAMDDAEDRIRQLKECEPKI